MASPQYAANGAGRGETCVAHTSHDVSDDSADRF
jgi:hypothetical protein